MKKLTFILVALFALVAHGATQVFTILDQNVLPSKFTLEGGFYPSPEVNVLSYGADTNGVADSRAAFVAAMAQVPSKGKLRIPRGTYKFSSAWTIAKSDYTVVSDGATLKYSPATITGNFLIMQGSRYEWSGIIFDGNNSAAQVVYVDAATGGAGIPSFPKCTFQGGFANDTNDPTQSTEVAGLFIKRGNQYARIVACTFTNITHVAAGTRTSAGLVVNDGGYTTSADANMYGLVEGCHFSQIGPGGFGDAIRFNISQNYDCGWRVAFNDFGDGIGFRGVKLICNGATVVNNFFHGTDSNARAAISDYGDNNVIQGNSILGQYVYGIEAGSNTGATVRNGMYLGNHIRFESGAISTGIGLRFLYNVMGGIVANNSVTDAARAIYADGKFYGNTIIGTRATNIANNAIELASDGSNAPWNCFVNDSVIINGGSNGVRISGGTNIYCGGVVGPTSGATLISWASGVTGGRTLSGRGDGMMLDWNGDPILGNYPIADDCLSTALTGAIGWTTSTANSGTAAVSSILDANHNGVYAVSTSTTVNGVGNIRTSGGNMLFGSRTLRYITCVKTPAAVSDGTDTYQIYAGFGDATTGANTDGAFFTYTHSLNSGNWTGQTMSGGSTTTASGGSNVACAANTYYWLGIEANSSNAKFYVATDSNGAPGAWTLIGASSSNLPTAGTTGLIHMIIKSLGTTARTFYMEKVFYQP